MAKRQTMTTAQYVDLMLSKAIDGETDYIETPRGLDSRSIEAVCGAHNLKLVIMNQATGKSFVHAENCKRYLTSKGFPLPL